MQTLRNAVILAAAIAAYSLIDRSATYQINSPGVVVITGATSGLGQDAAYHLAREQGFYVLAGARTKKKAELLQANSAASGIPQDRFKAIILDVTNSSHFAGALSAARAAIVKSGLPFAGLINNAGVHNHQLSSKTGPTLEQYRQLFEINVFAPVALVEAFDSLLRESKGRVVNVGSVAGDVSIPGTGANTAYAASKHALRSANDAMRQAYRSAGVSVSLIAPGYVKSQMCDPSKNSNCGVLGPAETTTPVFVDALTSPRPKTKYLTAHLGGGMSANIWIPIIMSLPTRAFDLVVAQFHA